MTILPSSRFNTIDSVFQMLGYLPWHNLNCYLPLYFNDFFFELQRKLRYNKITYECVKNGFLACILDDGVILWDPDQYSKSYSILIAYYMFYIARILSLSDTFIYILQKKQMDTFRVISGVFNGMAPTWLWVMAQFVDIPGYDFELIVYAMTQCLIYLYYFLVTIGK